MSNQVGSGGAAAPSFGLIRLATPGPIAGNLALLNEALLTGEKRAFGAQPLNALPTPSGAGGPAMPRHRHPEGSAKQSPVLRPPGRRCRCK